MTGAHDIEKRSGIAGFTTQQFVEESRRRGEDLTFHQAFRHLKEAGYSCRRMPNGQRYWLGTYPPVAVSPADRRDRMMLRVFIGIAILMCGAVIGYLAPR